VAQARCAFEEGLFSSLLFLLFSSLSLSLSLSLYLSLSLSLARSLSLLLFFFFLLLQKAFACGIAGIGIAGPFVQEHVDRVHAIDKMFRLEHARPEDPTPPFVDFVMLHNELLRIRTAIASADTEAAYHYLEELR